MEIVSENIRAQLCNSIHVGDTAYAKRKARMAVTFTYITLKICTCFHNVNINDYISITLIVKPRTKRKGSTKSDRPLKKSEINILRDFTGRVATFKKGYHQQRQK